MLTFLVGGARSGKSTLAVQMGEQHRGAVTFIATAEPFDDDLAARIERHRGERPPGWSTVEAPVDLAAAVRAVPDTSMVIVDCLTVWLANLLVHVAAASGRAASITDVIEAVRQREAPTVVVSNEVGMGIHPETPLGREYRDELGRLNQLVAAVADTSLLVVAGRAVRLDNPRELLQ